MKVKLLNTSNNKLKDEIGKEFNCLRLNGWLELEDLNTPGYGITTSTIEKVIRTEDSDENKKIFVFTKNSQYELEVIEEVENDNNY